MKEEMVFREYMELKSARKSIYISAAGETGCSGGTSCYSCGDSSDDGGGGE